MALRVIDLDPADTYYSVRDRLLRNGRSRTVLVFPEHGVHLGGIDLVRLRRLADRERLDVGLVTADKDLSRQARAVGLPSFSNLTLAEHYRPGWWRAGRRSEWLGFAPGEDRRPANRLGDGLSSATPTNSRHRLWLLSSLFAVILLAGLIAVAGVFAFPSATVTVRPNTLPVQVILELSADPELSAPSGLRVPARTLQYSQEWEATGPTTLDATADQQRIRAQALQGLGTAAPDYLTARLNPGETLVPASVQFKIIDESFTQSAEGSKLTLRATIAGTAVASADVNRVMYGELLDVLPEGYELEATTIRHQIEPASRSTSNDFQVTAQARGRAAVDPVALAQILRGRRAADVIPFLTTTFPLAEPPALEAGPGWWWNWVGRLPLRAERIRVKILP